MTDSVTTGKRERLITAACQMVHKQGVEKTTLADIAHAAGVPLGNVYYYFKTKDDIVRAVVEAHLREVSEMLAAIEGTHAEPRDRLKALFYALAEQTDLIARCGCPHGSLCLELDKRADGPGIAAELMRAPIDWVARQFHAMGRPDARDLAIQVIARYQGTALLTNTFRDPDLMTRESARVSQWIDSLDLPALPALPAHGLPCSSSSAAAPTVPAPRARAGTTPPATCAASSPTCGART
jgi:TetR/AcrR family transcriptional regulator, transcriptional repressor for nem operon